MCLCECPKDFVPVGEVRSIVWFEFQMMEIMMWCSSIQTKRHKSVSWPRKVISWMVLHWQPNVYKEENHFCQRMASKEHWVDSSKKTQWEQFPYTGILCSKSKCWHMLVMHLVEGLVEPRHLVMKQMPQEVLKIKQKQANTYFQQDLRQLWSYHW